MAGNLMTVRCFAGSVPKGVNYRLRVRGSIDDKGRWFYHYSTSVLLTYNTLRNVCGMLTAYRRSGQVRHS